MKRFHRALLRNLVAAICAPLFMLALAPIALADNQPYDDTNPHDTGCDSSMRQVATRQLGDGSLELHFSDNCHTAWAYFLCQNPSGCSGFTLWVKRIQDQKSETVWIGDIGYGTWAYTNQLNDAGAYQSYACYQGYFGAPQYCTSAY